MEQGNRLDSTCVSASQGEQRNSDEVRAIDRAAARLLSGDAPPSRRSVLAGLLGAATPVPALATVSGAPFSESPDRMLLVVEADLVRASADAERAAEASSAAHAALWRALGHCPDDLIASTDALGRLTTPGALLALRRQRLFQWVNTEAKDDDCWAQAWTGHGLRVAIKYAVPVFGTGGQTPHRIREWRRLIPVADAFDGHRSALERTLQVRELSEASRTARDAESLLSRKLATYTASTIDGLGALARHVGTFGWERMPSEWIGLLLSVAKITDVDLGIPDFDVERWARELESVGGRILPPNRYDSGGIQWPASYTSSAEQKATITRLSREQQDHKIQVRLFVERGGLAA